MVFCVQLSFVMQGMNSVYFIQSGCLLNIYQKEIFIAIHTNVQQSVQQALTRDTL